MRFFQKWGLILKATAFVFILLVAKIIIDFLNLDIISINPLITSFVGGVIFTIAIIFSGAFADYKESEKIPGELAVSIKALYKDSRIIHVTDKKIIHDMQSHIKELLNVINSNLKNNIWRLREINPVIDKIDNDISFLAEKNVAPQFIVKLRNEVTNIDRISSRIEIISETTFIPAAYGIAEMALGAVLFVLLFARIDPYYEGIILTGVVSSLLVSLLLLIKDMDNPFEAGKKGSCANVDLSLLFKLEEYFKSIKEMQ